MKRNKKKNIMIIVLCFVLLLMGVGYAVVSQRLTIGGTAKMQGEWDVRITNIQLSRKTGLAKDNSHKYENLSASFQTETLAPGDMLEYTVSVSNKGNIDALVSEINATLDGPEAIKYTVEGIKKGDVIKEGVTKEVIITIKFDENATVIPSNKTSTLNINFTCIQNTQNVPTENLTVYKTRMKKAENSPSETTNFFNGPITRNKIKKITFYDTLNVEGYSNNFDISEDSSGKVLAWYKTDSNGYYELAIGQDGGVIANPNMAFYFAKMPVLEEINLEKLDTFGVTNMTYLFYYTNSLKMLDVTNFDTGNVTSMMDMFAHCGARTINLEGLNTSKVTDMYHMFSESENLEYLDLSSFDTSKVTNMDGMFGACKKLKKLNISSFDTSNVTNMASMFVHCNLLEELDVSGFNTSKVRNMNTMFWNCTNLKELDVSGFNTSNVTNMSRMFSDCKALLKLNLKSFDTSKVTNMSYMFYDCTSLLELDLSSFNTSNVTNMSRMFSDCTGIIRINLTSFNTSKVTDMAKMFYACYKLESLDLTSFNTSKVTDMNRMFAYCYKLGSLDLTSFDTTNVKNFEEIFTYTKSISAIHVGNKWTTSNATNTSNMFLGSKVQQVTNI